MKRCRTDDAGFHVDKHGRRTTHRWGIDGYAYRCRHCGTVGQIQEGRFIRR